MPARAGARPWATTPSGASSSRSASPATSPSGWGNWALKRGDKVRIDSACSVEDWCTDPERNQRRIADTFREACLIAADHGVRLAAEGEICWGGMHSWKRMIQLLEMVDRPQTLGFQADMSHTLLYLLGYNAPEDALLPPDFAWRDTGSVSRQAYRR